MILITIALRLIGWGYATTAAFGFALLGWKAWPLAVAAIVFIWTGRKLEERRQARKLRRHMARQQRIEQRAYRAAA
jgi:heme exporter protein D